MEALNVVRVKLVREFQLASLGKIESPTDAVKIAADYLSDFSQELFGICCMSSKGEVVNLAILGQGTVNTSLVDLRSVFQAIILSNAASVICLHNHPSGDCRPSKEDYEVTQKIKTVCEILGYTFLDHIITGGEQYYSFREEKKLKDLQQLSFEKLLDLCCREQPEMTMKENDTIDFEL